MPNATPLVHRADAAGRGYDNCRPSMYAKLARFSDLEAERDALREMVKQARARERFFRWDVLR